MMVASASKLAEQSVRVIVMAFPKSKDDPLTTSMFCWGVYVWDGPDVWGIRTVKNSAVASRQSARPAGRRDPRRPDKLLFVCNVCRFATLSVFPPCQKRTWHGALDGFSARPRCRSSLAASAVQQR